MSGEKRVTVNDVMARQRAMDLGPVEYAQVVGILSAMVPETVNEALDVLDKRRAKGES